MVYRSRLLFATAFVAVLIAGVPAAASAQNHPRLGLYGAVFGDGYPLWNSSGVIDGAELDKIARYHEVVLDASPITEYRPDVALALRARRPDIRLLAYVTGHAIWFANQPDSTVHYPTRYWRTVRDLDGFLYNTSGGLYGSQSNQAGNVNLAKKDASGRFVVANALADLFYDAIVRTGVWDGVFIDVFCDNILWMEASGEYINITRAGYANRTVFAQAWKAATDTLAYRLRQLSGSTEVLVGNCAAGTKYGWFNGWMRENFPYQNGGTWYTNMFNDPGGYFVDEQHWLTPRHNYIFTASQGTATPYTSENARRVRFGLGTASLADGYGVFGNAARAIRTDPYMHWWYDEYAVDLSTGMSSNLIQHTGWLGAALAPYYQMVWVGPTPDIVTNPGFETNVTTGWQFNTSIGSTVTRDVSTSPAAPSGNASVHITVPTATPGIEWSTAYYTTTNMPVFQNGYYSATFWARAAWPRNIQVGCGYAGGGGTFASLNLYVDTQWRRYQAVLQPHESGQGRLDFFLANEAGDVWLDDVHFQQGVYSVYRRDFQNGSVLVNPGNTSLDVVMESPMRRIAGAVSPTINNGTNSVFQTVLPSDAVFLIGTDAISPAAVQDLHAVPPPPSPLSRDSDDR